MDIYDIQTYGHMSISFSHMFISQGVHIHIAETSFEKWEKKDCFLIAFETTNGCLIICSGVYF